VNGKQKPKLADTVLMRALIEGEKMKKETVLESRIYDVKGTTKLDVYDPEFPQPRRRLEFHGNISAAPLGKMKIERVHIEVSYLDRDGKEQPRKYDKICVMIVQGAYNAALNLYLSGRHYFDFLKAAYDLNCKTGCFAIETKYGSDSFDTGADGLYGSLYQMKQYHGMILNLGFDADLYTIDEIEKRMLRLWPKNHKRSIKE
jgi:hypothetical protein